MINNYKPAHDEWEVHYQIIYEYEDGSGFAFPCDSQGNIYVSELPEAAWKNLQWCIENANRFVKVNELEVNKWRYRVPASGTCDCGNEIDLIGYYYGATRCEKCGRWYNVFGQELLPPEDWEEDPSGPYWAWETNGWDE